MTASSVFLDTNILVYSVDRSEPEKESRAVEVIDFVQRSGNGTISPQVIAEFISASRRVRPKLTQVQVDRVIDPALRTFALLPINAAVTREALRCWRRYSISYWDAQIWATARIAGVDVILSEDCPAAELEGVRYINPFAEGFSLDDLASL